MNLLERLAGMTGCGYMSDLHFVNREELCEALEHIPAEGHPADEWMDAEEYLCGFPALDENDAGTRTARSARRLDSENIRRRLLGRLSDERARPEF